MIASLTGTIERTSQGRIVLNVGGVGYLVNVPLSTQMKMPGEGGTAKLNIITVVREDDISLYGFATEAEEMMFTLLQDVNGVGPKLAQKILSGIEPQKFRNAIIGNDLNMLSSITGVGKKLAQRLVVELKDKVIVLPGHGLEPEDLGPVAGPMESEAVEALSALGYQPRVARRAMETARREGQTVEELIRDALKVLAPKR